MTKPTLAEVRKNPEKYKQDSEASLAEANLEQNELSKLEAIICDLGPKKERQTATVELPGGIEMLVYFQLSGGEEQLLGTLQNESLKARAWRKRQKKGKEPNFGSMLDAMIRLCSSICAEDDIDGEDPEDFFLELHERVGTEKLMDVLNIMLKPFEEYQGSIQKFRPNNK